MNMYTVGFNDMTYYDVSRDREIKTAIWYPSQDSSEVTTYFNAYTGFVKREASIYQSHFPLILISHGSKGHRINQHYIAEHLAANGYIVAAIEHTGDTSTDDSQSHESINLINRHTDILYIVETLLEDAFYKAHINETDIGIIGHSFGAFTALTIAGARPNKRYKEDAFQSYTRAIKAVVILAPALHELFDGHIINNDTPILFFKSENDEILGKDDLAYLRLFSHIYLINLKNAGHYIYLMQCPDKLKEVCPDICIDVGMRREDAHPLINDEILKFLNHTFGLQS